MLTVIPGARAVVSPDAVGYWGAPEVGGKHMPEVV